jgi:hypothetical protein
LHLEETVVYFPTRSLRSRRTLVRRLITFSYCIASFIAAGALAPRALAKTTLDFIAGKSLSFRSLPTQTPAFSCRETSMAMVAKISSPSSF